MQAQATASRLREFLSGCRDELPILLGVAPFGMIFGALAVSVGIDPIPTQSTSAIIFAGSSQFIAAGLIGSGAPALMLVLVVAVVNLRHMLYSASIAPYLQRLSAPWKLALSYLLTDEAYAVAISRFQRDDAGGVVSPLRHWYVLGCGLALWSTWQVSTLAGILLGARIPAEWSLSFALPLTFIALVVPALKDRPQVAAALSASLTALALYRLPYLTWLPLAAFAGILAGMLAERRRP